MKDSPRVHNLGSLIFGLAVIAFGLILLLDNLHLIRAETYTQFWPVVLIVFGLAKLLQPRGSGGKFFGFILTLVGAVFLAKNLDLISWDVWDLWPVILVLVGLNIFRHAFFRRPVVRMRGGRDSLRSGPPEASAESVVDSFTAFGGTDRANTSQDFRGGRITAIMGGCDLDLRRASIASGEAVLDVLALWGGIEIRVPEDWEVVLRGTAALGGFSDETHHPVGGKNKVLIVTGWAIMGGVEVKN